MPGILSRIPKYWLFQCVGWGLFIFINTFFAITLDKFSPGFIARVTAFVCTGFFFSHLMRIAIKRSNILKRPLKQQIIGFIILTFVFAGLVGIVETFLTGIFNIRIRQEDGLPDSQVAIYNVFVAFVYLFMWNCIYFIYHFIEKSRNQQLDTLKLQALVKELELKTIKSHINPHFIFNALNSIRALIDENPSRARNAITELSNILRSSMQSENLETVPLERELNIVKDYLALEHIRFEDRLKVEYDIDEDTLDHPVPPMMLQTLVENAIKHGISKNVEGGTVRIISDFVGDHHEIIVRNTGRLNGGLNKEGFGLNSTANRLGLLFGGSARLEIHDMSDNMVEAKVIIPAQVA
jgi:two-component system LytT family sensor kinase